MDALDSYIALDSAGARSDDLSNSLLNFTTGPDDLDLQGSKRQKSARDPMSHRIIEKRRRDRMNNCLADLSRLIPTSYLKQGQGRIEKTEIIEMAIKHIKTLQAQVDSSHNAGFTAMATMKRDTGTSIEGTVIHQAGGGERDQHCCQDQFYQGYKECQDETLRYLVEGEAMVASDPFCVRVMDHLSTQSQRFCLARTRTGTGDDKKDALMDVENQQQQQQPPPPHALPGNNFSSAFGNPPSSSTSTPTSLPSLDPMLPLLPTSPGARMVPASPPIRNKQLRNLLSARALQQLEAEREGLGSQSQHHDFRSSASDGGSSSATGTPPISVPASTVTSDGLNGSCTSSGYMSDASAMERFSSSGLGELVNAKDCTSAMNAYKFKHSITKRFSQEGKVIAQQYHGSSSTSSREAEDELPHHGSSFKHRSMKNKNRYASSSDSGPYPTSELSGGTSSDGGPDRNRNRKAIARSPGGSSDLVLVDSECCPSRSTMPLPGFVLHPSGTHYMPISVCYSNIPDVFDQGRDGAGLGPPVFHPISIPVHFRGAVISLPGSSLCPQGMVKNADSASQPKDTKGVKKLQE